MRRAPRRSPGRDKVISDESETVVPPASAKADEATNVIAAALKMRARMGLPFWDVPRAARRGLN